MYPGTNGFEFQHPRRVSLAVLPFLLALTLLSLLGIEGMMTTVLRHQETQRLPARAENEILLIEVALAQSMAEGFDPLREPRWGRALLERKRSLGFLPVRGKDGGLIDPYGNPYRIRELPSGPTVFFQL